MIGGQALRRHRWLRWFLAVLVAIPLLGGAATGALLWRLGQGPLVVPMLARQIEQQLTPDGGRGRLSVAEARLAWDGFRGTAPIEVQISGVTLRDEAGRMVGSLPDSSLFLAPRPLLRGRLAPTEIALRGPEVRLRREEDGRIHLDLPGEGEAQEAGPADATGDLLAGLMRPDPGDSPIADLRRLRIRSGLVTVQDQAMDRVWRLQGVEVEIRRSSEGVLSADGEAELVTAGATVPVHVSGEGRGEPWSLTARLGLPVLRPAEIGRIFPAAEALTALDAPLALEAAASFDKEGTPRGVSVSLSAPEGGRIAGLPFAALDARLHATEERLDLEEARIRVGQRSLSAQGVLLRHDAGWRGRLNLGAEAVEAEDFAGQWPGTLWPEARAVVIGAWPRGRVEALSLGLDVMADGALREWRVESGEAQARATGMTLTLEGLGRINLDAAELDAAATRGALTLRRAEIRLEPVAPGAPGPVLQASGAARSEAGKWRGSAELALDRVRIADLRTLWPAGLGGPERIWITENLTAGEIRNGRWTVEAEAAGDFSSLTPLALNGEARVEGATVHWLRPVPPIRGVSATVRFGLEEVTVSTRGGRQERDGGEVGALEVRDANLRFLLPAGRIPRTEMTLNLAGPVADVVAIVRHPRLHLFDRRPFPVTVAAGAMEGTLNLSFPLIANLTTDQLRLRAESRVRGGRLTRLLLERDLDEINAELTLDTESMRVAGNASFAGTPVRVGAEMDFRQGPATQIVSRETASGRFDARVLAELGFDAGGMLSGPVAIEARTERRRNSQGTVALRGDLRDSVLRFSPLKWVKPRGTPGSAEASLRLNGDSLTSIENIRIEALELALRGRAVAPRGSRIERVEFAESLFGGSRFVGEARASAQRDGPWSVALRGPVLDLRPVFGPTGHVSGGAARDRLAPNEAEGDAPPLLLDLRFDQVLMGERRDVFGVVARGATDSQGVIREATLRGATARGAGGFELTLAPRGQARLLRGTADDGGALLNALGITSSVRGGRMSLSAQYAENRPGAPLSGTAELEQFVMRDAPALGKALQAMTLYGLVEAMQGGTGLAFARAIVPFTLTPEEVRIADARAFSASLGVTARGRLLRERSVLDMEGTIVPAYFFNSLLGNLPLIGRLFSPEAGGGLFAATFRAQGDADDPQVTVNPLAALTPGFLRGLFGLAESGAPRR
ncbi:AsmA-like C-terminal region-containing protein [Sabulicella rubraurantiaca]|uniref:AsmA-like C-terminal region-containing protein n=1 Tax=Sabulicella rubraurantiaca TaxID=2811429 RepID=UPI001A977465|nr:AsmA-like C-terminal region-containing protein [Sabulicella rubraurantiaca]